jgi:hypothetical protein
MIQVYWHEAQIACSLYAFGSYMMKKEGVPILKLFRETSFLAKILSREYVLENKMIKFKEFSKLLNILIKRNILKEEQDKIKVIQMKFSKLIL